MQPESTTSSKGQAQKHIDRSKPIIQKRAGIIEARAKEIVQDPENEFLLKDCSYEELLNMIKAKPSNAMVGKSRSIKKYLRTEWGNEHIFENHEAGGKVSVKVEKAAQFLAYVQLQGEANANIEFKFRCNDMDASSVRNSYLQSVSSKKYIINEEVKSAKDSLKETENDPPEERQKYKEGYVNEVKGQYMMAKMLSYTFEVAMSLDKELAQEVEKDEASLRDATRCEGLGGCCLLACPVPTLCCYTACCSYDCCSSNSNGCLSTKAKVCIATSVILLLCTGIGLGLYFGLDGLQDVHGRC